MILETTAFGGVMNPDQLAKLHRDLCNQHNDLTVEVLRLDASNPQYQLLMNAADQLYSACTSAYAALRVALTPSQ
jgi:hypothetical protein